MMLLYSSWPVKWVCKISCSHYITFRNCMLCHLFFIYITQTYFWTYCDFWTFSESNYIRKFPWCHSQVKVGYLVPCNLTVKTREASCLFLFDIFALIKSSACMCRNHYCVRNLGERKQTPLTELAITLPFKEGGAGAGRWAVRFPCPQLVGAR